MRFGTIGTSKITDKLIAAGNEVSDFTLSAVYSRTAEQAKAFAEKHGAEKYFTDLEEMAKSDAIDAVYIASPNSLHAEQACKFMKNGKHVLCEKPLASNVRETEKMFEAARNYGVTFMEALKTTLLPNFKVIRENLDRIGPVRRYVGNYCQYSSKYDPYKKGDIKNAFRPEFSNGSLMDIGVYCLYPMISLFGPPKNVQSHAFLLNTGVDGEGSILATYDDKIAVVMYSKITDSHVPSEIQGEAGSLIFDSVNETSEVKIKWRDGTVEDLTVPQTKAPMAYELEHFIGLAAGGEQFSPVNTPDCSLETAAVMEEARRQIGLTFPADEK